MRFNSLMIFALTLFLILGVVLIGKGITGLVSNDDPFIKEVCSTDDDCSNVDVCCIFHEENSGACASEDMCAQITALTKAEKEGIEQYSVEFYPDSKIPKIIETLAGSIIIIGSIFLFMYVSAKERKVRQKSPRKTY